MSTKEENERLARVEEKTENIEKKVDALDIKFDTLIDKLDQKYAAKWVQVVVGGLVAAILLAFIGAVTIMVIPDPQPVQTQITER